MGSEQNIYESSLQIQFALPAKIIGPALDSIELESIKKHLNKVRHYMSGYLEGLPGIGLS